MGQRYRAGVVPAQLLSDSRACYLLASGALEDAQQSRTSVLPLLTAEDHLSVFAPQVSSAASPTPSSSCRPSDPFGRNARLSVSPFPQPPADRSLVPITHFGHSDGPSPVSCPLPPLLLLPSPPIQTRSINPTSLTTVSSLPLIIHPQPLLHPHPLLHPQPLLHHQPLLHLQPTPTPPPPPVVGFISRAHRNKPSRAAEEEQQRVDEELRERVAMEQEQERSMQQFQAALELKRKRDREANVGAEVGR